ncbi:MAG: hypothetical protein GXX91_11985 [Verrucomicrobiaceae bacterium]|nr:hypothetical protein [Verrucomicrobiaceae bacterium]
MRWKTSLLTLVGLSLSVSLQAEFTAGSAITDVTPKQLPVLVNGGMTSRSIDKIKTPVSARSLAFSDGKETLVIVVVDSCMIGRELIDTAKDLAAEKAGIPRERILISATHTHTAPSSMGCLGTDPDPAYSPFLTKKLVEAILAPLQDMRPAQIGWGEIDAADYTALRRWVIHPKHIKEDPFGNPTVRANMHAGANWDHVTGPSGPEDPMLSLISVQTTDGEPIGLLANFSMHYFGDKDISADYFGLFANGLQDKLDPDKSGFVAIMSHGCSGDIWRHDYEKTPKRGEDALTIEQYSQDMVDFALKALEGVTYESPASIAMAETRMTLAYRVPDKQRLEWAEKVMAEVGDRLVKTRPEIYAREQILLHEKQETEVVVQGLRLGENIAIATTPNETYAISGLKIKAASPAPHTMVIELANGGDGYIPPPEQHLLGGYNTWPARSAGLEVQAEPKITEAAIQMLEKVTAQPRADRRAEAGPAVAHTLDLKPRAYWRLDEFAGPRAVDSSPNGIDALYEPQVLFYLPGPNDAAFAKGGINRSAHFAGDRLSARFPGMTGGDFTVSLWFWSGTAKGVMDGTEWLFSRGNALALRESGDHIGLREDAEGNRSLVHTGAGGKESPLASSIERWKWHHLVVIRSGNEIQWSLDGAKTASFPVESASGKASDTFFFGGSCTGDGNFEGRLDEIAVFDRALSSEEITALSQKSRP